MVNCHICGRSIHAQGAAPLCRCAEEMIALRTQIHSLERNEYICKKCGIRKDSDHPKGDF